MPSLPRIFLFTLASLAFASLAHAETPRETIAKAILSEDAEEQTKFIGSLSANPAPEIRELFAAWRESGIYIYELPNGAEIERVPILLTGKSGDGKQAAIRLSDGQPLKNEKGEALALVASDLTTAETDSNVRRAMKSVLDLADLGSPDPIVRRKAVEKLGMDQNIDQLPTLVARQGLEKDPRVQTALREATALLGLKSDKPEIQADGARTLGEMRSIPSQDALTALIKESPGGSAPALAATDALREIAGHTKWVNFYGTIFRGASAGSVLLVAAIGLAITFGLMGVINMAHGELIAVGAYATYFVQNLFGPGIALSPFGMPTFRVPGLNLQGAAYDAYFIIALPIAFLSAALVGLALERGIIRFLYRRPLESLLATWGVSLVLQQLFRLVIGSNNVQVDSPKWLSGNWTVFDVIFGWNRVFVIGFSIAIIVGVWLLLTRTPLGLLIRAVMQNRQMAACMGVRTERVNMLTFGLGSGLAGLAGAFFSQIGNVGPGLGQDHIVNAFMTVVVGGVGSIAGTVVSALGIGVANEALQQILLDPVLGKIVVLGIIILFLQWKPAGIFVTRSRSLEG